MGQINIGVNNVARNVKNVFIGVDGVARAVKNVYIGDENGKARLVWRNKIDKAISYLGMTRLGNFSINNNMIWAYFLENISDVHFIFGVKAIYNGELNGVYLLNVFLNTDGSIKSYNKTLIANEQFSSYQIDFGRNMEKLNNTVGICTTTLSNFNDGSKTKYVYAINLDNGSEISRIQTLYGSDTELPLITLNDNTIMLPVCSSGGYVYGEIYEFKNNTFSRKYSNAISPSIAYEDNYHYCDALVLPLSNNRFCTIYYTTSSTIFAIYNYSFDTNDNITVTLQTKHKMSRFKLYDWISLDNDDFILCGGYDNAYALHINSDNTYSLSSVSNSNITGTRIGTSNSVYTYTSSTTSIVYDDTKTNTITKTYSSSTDALPSNSYSKFAPYGDDNILSMQLSGKNIYIDKLSFK